MARKINKFSSRLLQKSEKNISFKFITYETKISEDTITANTSCHYFYNIGKEIENIIFCFINNCHHLNVTFNKVSSTLFCIY